MRRPTVTWLTVLVVSLALVALACAQATTPSPSPSPSAPPAKPSAQTESKPSAQAEKPAATESVFQQLVKASEAEMTKKGGKLSVALELETNEGPAILDAFKKEFPFVKETIYERVRTPEQMQRLLTEAKAGRAPNYDVAHISFESWQDFSDAGMFAKPPFSYKALINALPQGWTAPDPRAVDEQDAYIATTGLARGIAWNKNLVPKGQEPTTWEACLDPKWKGNFIYDPRPKLTALQHDPKTRESHLAWLRGIVGNSVVLTRGQSEGLEKVAAGEYAIFCGVNYHSALRAIDDGAPLEFAFPDPFSLEFGTQIHVVKWSQTPATTQLLVLFMATKAQPLMEKAAYRGFPWDPDGRKFPMAKGKYAAVCDTKCLAKSEEYDKEHGKILGLPGY